MATLKGQAAIDFIKKNPTNKTYQILSGGNELAKNQDIQNIVRQQQAELSRRQAQAEKQRKKYSGLGGFIRGAGEAMIDPAVRAVKLGQTAGAAIFNPKDKKRLIDKYYGGKLNVGGELIRTGAGLASYAVPLGGTWTRAIIGGAGAGALGAVGGKDIRKLKAEDILTGATIGAITGGVIKGVGGKLARRSANKALQEAEEAGVSTLSRRAADAEKSALKRFALNREASAIRKSVGGTAPNMNIGGGPLLKEAAILAKEAGVVIKSPQDLARFANMIQKEGGQIAEAVGRVKAPVSGNFATDLAGTSSKIDAKKIYQELLDEASQIKAGGVRTPKMAAVEQIGQDLRGARSLEDLYAIKQNYGGEGTSKGLARFTEAPNPTTSMQSEVYQKAYGGLNDLIDQELQKTGFDQFKNINQRVSTAKNLEKYANTAMAKEAPGNLPARLLGLPKLVAENTILSPRVDRALASVAERIPSPRLPGLPNVPGLSNAAGNQMLQRSARLGASGSVTRDDVNRQTTEIPEMDQSSLLGQLQQYMPQEGQEQMTGATSPDVQAIDQILQSDQMIRQQQQPQLPDKATLWNQAMQMSGGNMKYTPAIFNTLVSQARAEYNSALKQNASRILPPAQVKTLNEIKTSIQGLNDLEQVINENKNRFGLVQGGVLGNLATTFGHDAQRNYVKSKIGTVSQIISKALEGGVLREGDRVYYQQYVPKMTDTPAQALNKIRAFREEFSKILRNQSQGFQTSGYNPYFGETAGTLDQQVANDYLNM